MPNCNATGRQQAYPTLFSHSLVNSFIFWMIDVNKYTVTDTKECCMVTYQPFLRLVKLSYISVEYHQRSSKGNNKEIYMLIHSFLFPGQIQWITSIPLSINPSSVTLLKGQWEKCSRRALVVSCILNWLRSAADIPRTDGCLPGAPRAPRQVLPGARS